MLSGRAIDSVPRIGNCQGYVVAGIEPFEWAGAGVEYYALGRDLYFTTFWHRVPRIDHQVEQDLFDLPLVGFDQACFRLQGRCQMDILTDHLLQHIA